VNFLAFSNRRPPEKIIGPCCQSSGLARGFAPNLTLTDESSLGVEVEQSDHRIVSVKKLDQVSVILGTFVLAPAFLIHMCWSCFTPG